MRMCTPYLQDLYHVILEGVDVMYNVVGDNEIVVVGAELGGSGGRVMLAQAEAHAPAAAVATAGGASMSESGV